jgi:hypothetical protein
MFQLKIDKYSQTSKIRNFFTLKLAILRGFATVGGAGCGKRIYFTVLKKVILFHF